MPTVPTGTEIEAFLATVEEAKRKDALTLIELMHRVTGQPPVLSGSMIGFGRYHYRYESGREGDAALVAFAPRKAEFSIYLTGTDFPEQEAGREALLVRLGKHKIGKACLYVKRLADIDLDVLEQLVRMSVERLRRHYPEPAAAQ